MRPPELEADLDLGVKTSLSTLILGKAVGEGRWSWGRSSGLEESAELSEWWRLR